MKATDLSLYFHPAHSSINCLDRRIWGSDGFGKWLKSKRKRWSFETLFVLSRWQCHVFTVK